MNCISAPQEKAEARQVGARAFASLRMSRRSPSTKPADALFCGRTRDEYMATDGKVALVTGAARGIGLATARRFLAEGWRVALLDIDGGCSSAPMADLAAPDATLALPCDVADAAAVVRAVQPSRGALRPARRAGQQCRHRDLQAAAGDDAGGLAARARGQPHRAVPVHPGRGADDGERGGGAIVNITSISGLRASTLRVAYGTSKAALAHLTKQQAVELAALGIRVNAVAPGPVDTAMAKAVHTPEIRADYHDAIPLNRYGLEEGAGRGDLLPVQRPRELHHRPGARGRWRLRRDGHRPADLRGARRNL